MMLQVIGNDCTAFRKHFLFPSIHGCAHSDIYQLFWWCMGKEGARKFQKDKSWHGATAPRSTLSSPNMPLDPPPNWPMTLPSFPLLTFSKSGAAALCAMLLLFMALAQQHVPADQFPCCHKGTCTAHPRMLVLTVQGSSRIGAEDAWGHTVSSVSKGLNLTVSGSKWIPVSVRLETFLVFFRLNTFYKHSANPATTLPVPKTLAWNHCYLRLVILVVYL